MSNRTRGTMYVPCPACGTVRTLKLKLDTYNIGKALHRSCWTCSMKTRRRGHALAAKNAADLAIELDLINDSPERAAQRLGTTPTALARRFYRAGMPEHARPFQRATKNTRKQRRDAA